MPITLLIADEFEVVRAGLKSMVAGSGIKVVAEASSGKAAVRLACQAIIVLIFNLRSFRFAQFLCQPTSLHLTIEQRWLQRFNKHQVLSVPQFQFQRIAVSISVNAHYLCAVLTKDVNLIDRTRPWQI